MNKAMSGMQEIPKKVHDLLENSQKIDWIVTTIKDIADQTKLLALNASSGCQLRGAIGAEHRRRNRANLCEHGGNGIRYRRAGEHG